VWFFLLKIKKRSEETGHLVHFSYKNAAKSKAIITDTETPGSKRAELKYKLIDKIDRYSLLEVELITGRFHQIRAQLAAIGAQIKGDVKYGFKRGNKDRSIHLHAWKLEFEHPVSGERVTIEAPLPTDNVWQAFTL